MIGYEVFYSMTAVEDLDQVQLSLSLSFLISISLSLSLSFPISIVNVMTENNDDFDQWQRKTVGMTTSIDLLNLERHAQVMMMGIIRTAMMMMMMMMNMLMIMKMTKKMSILQLLGFAWTEFNL